jgi:hypothetical protein
MIVSVHPEIADFWMELSAVNYQPNEESRIKNTRKENPS